MTERVSVKMVAKTEDGTILKKLFKPIEDSTHEGIGGKRNIFVLSKNKDERMQWVSMEVVVIIDRRPECTLKVMTQISMTQRVAEVLKGVSGIETVEQIKGCTQEFLYK